MKQTLKNNPRFGVMVIFSLLLHLTIYIIFYQFNNLLRPIYPREQTYYVDLVNLPVARPQSGTPSASVKNSPPASSTTRQEMKLPDNSRKKAGKAATSPSIKKTPKIKPAPETGEELSRQMAKLEKRVEEKHARSALDAIRNKAGGGRVGIPGGMGNQAGSDYASYVKSRLEDAFYTPIAYKGKKPEVKLLLRISRYGKIDYRIEQSSHDILFEAAVRRAIDMARENLKLPPDGEDFEHSFVFRPEGVKKK
jgi:colicin import membrane protein